MDLFFDVIQGRWGLDEASPSPFSLDRFTAFKVHTLKKNVLAHWLRALKKDGSDRMVYLFLNGARNLGDPGAAKTLIEIASDRDRTFPLRREAILSFSFLTEVSVGELLLEYAGKEGNRELADLARRVFWNFF